MGARGGKRWMKRSGMGEDESWIVEKYANPWGEERVWGRHARCRRWLGHRRQRGDARNFDLGDTLAGPYADGWHGAKFVLAPDGLDVARASFSQAGMVINVINARAVVTSKAGLLQRDEGNRMMAGSWGKAARDVDSNDRFGVYYRGCRMRRDGRMGDSGGRKVGWRDLESLQEGWDSEGMGETHSRVGVWLEMVLGNQFKRRLERLTVDDTSHMEGNWGRGHRCKPRDGTRPVAWRCVCGNGYRAVDSEMRSPDRGRSGHAAGRKGLSRDHSPWSECRGAE